MGSSKIRALHELRAAIKELGDAMNFLAANRFESAENEIGDALVLIGRAIRNINRAEACRRFVPCKNSLKSK
ncbi:MULTISPECIES: hypothetical protein [Thermoactinomyces]|jgi:hypothetical protein|uniref:Uncharacterized protein n=1 Tax=Thermoactinomyces daqus TaxID=1329516 RepID=A0A7W2AJ09_9BACL|nr:MULTISPECIES: hypothetical protein [Thermoactinomyces]MBA4543284.1 hypothetical protein [Thermoactinomyces daqus]MBH8599561.1 hypothetical protein [Thermoactinomyces sp. CICC 10523]MBH8605694.1 hypothetical protein [Thermoactinomyces sp. CICC 10522]MBH8608906.1 hypothetical protein [Thermoactinomyces sp. CICC 10521]